MGLAFVDALTRFGVIGTPWVAAKTPRQRIQALMNRMWTRWLTPTAQAGSGLSVKYSYTTLETTPPSQKFQRALRLNHAGPTARVASQAAATPT